MRSTLPAGSIIVAVGLWTRDGAPDVLVRDGSGRMLLYPGNGPGGLDDPRVIGTGFDGYNTLVGVGDLTGDGHADLVGRLRQRPDLAAARSRPQREGSWWRIRASPVPRSRLERLSDRLRLV